MTSPSDATDEELMRLLQSGDDLALNRLMERWQTPLRGFLYRYVQNGHDALDLAQETFVRVYQHRARFHPEKRFSTWLFAIALNLARSRARWWRRHPTLSLESGLEGSGGMSQASDEATPADATLAAETVAAIRAAIAALPDDLRAAVLLFEYEEKSHAEIAAIVGASPKAIETRLYRARRLLKKSLAKHLKAG